MVRPPPLIEVRVVVGSEDLAPLARAAEELATHLVRLRVRVRARVRARAKVRVRV